MNDVSILFVTTTARRRDRIAREIADKQGAHQWLFIAQDELTAESFLFEPITYNIKGEAGPLLKR